MGDKYDRALAKFREQGGDTRDMKPDELDALSKLSRESSSRGNLYRAVRDGNMK